MKRGRVLHEKVLVSHQIIPYPQTKEKLSSFKFTLHQLWQGFVHYLTQPPEPKVWKKTNRHGEIFWEVYDPYRNLKATFTSELEVRMWLDQRYYQ